MKVIIAGSREIVDRSVLEDAINKSGFTITEVVSGEARGVDTLGSDWAEDNSVPVTSKPALWDDLTVENCAVKTNSWGKKYNSLAGFNRNKEMAEYADALIAIWDGNSPGTKDMLYQAKKIGIPIYLHKSTHDDNESVPF